MWGKCCAAYVFVICIHMVDHDKWPPGASTETSRMVHKSSSDREPVECMVNPTQPKFVGFAN
jgi:hypothetical protein